MLDFLGYVQWWAMLVTSLASIGIIFAGRTRDDMYHCDHWR